METTQQKLPHVVFVTSPGMGHLLPVVELANWLIHHHGFLVTFIITTDGSFIKPQKAVLKVLPNSISSIFLPLVNFEDLPEDVRIETRIALTVILLLFSYNCNGFVFDLWFTESWWKILLRVVENRKQTYQASAVMSRCNHQAVGVDRCSDQAVTAESGWTSKKVTAESGWTWLKQSFIINSSFISWKIWCHVDEES